MLCININQTPYLSMEQMRNQLEELTKNFDSMLNLHDETTKNIKNINEESVPVENLIQSMEDLIDHAQIECFGNDFISPERYTQKERVKILKFLNENDYFLLRGSVANCAKRLCCSEASIYRYLSQLNK
jgi:predicted transcriptional regulator YheO